MRRRLRIVILFLTVFIVLSIILLKHSAQDVNLIVSEEKLENVVTKPEIAVVVCGNRSAETLNMIKSALLFSKNHIHFQILTDDASKIKPKVGYARVGFDFFSRGVCSSWKNGRML